MEDAAPLIDHFSRQVELLEEEKTYVTSLVKIKRVKKKQFIDQPGFVSKYRNYVVQGSMRAYIIGNDGQEHTISLAIEDWWIGDPASFYSQEPATLFVEALEDSILIQLSYEAENLLIENIPKFERLFRLKWQRTAVMMQRRVISNISISAEERYDEFANRYPKFIQRIPQYIIASYLGMTREFLSKIRNNKINFKNKVN